MPPYHFDGVHCRDSQGAFVPVAQCRRKKKPGGQLGHVAWGEAKKVIQTLESNSRAITRLQKKEKPTSVDKDRHKKLSYMNDGIMQVASKLGLECVCYRDDKCACRLEKGGKYEWQK